MQAKDSFQMDLMFEINDCILYDTSNSQLKQLHQGVLAIYELKSHNLIVLKLAEWQYSLSKSIPIMASMQANRKVYALPKSNGNFGLLLGQRTTDEQVIILESIFNSHADFVVSTPDGNSDAMQQQQQQQQQVDENAPKSTSKKIQGYLQMGGDFIRSGLITGAGFLAQGIQSGGQYIKSKITKPTQKEIKPETLAKVKMAKAASSAVLTFTQAQVSALISGAKVVGKEVGDAISTSETGQKISSHKHFDDVKNVAKGTVHAVAAIYDGMFEGLCAIGRGIQGATTDVVQHKYGEGAGQLAHESFETVANVGQVAKSFQTETVKAVHEGTQSRIFNQPQI